MKIMEDIISSYDTAYVNPKTQVVRFENSRGWYEEFTLTEEIAFIILMKGMNVVYEG